MKKKFPRLLSGLENDRGTDRNRRVSATLSPIFYLFLAPSGKLYLKVQNLLAHGETHDASPPPIVGKRRPGPKYPKCRSEVVSSATPFRRSLVMLLRHSLTTYTCIQRATSTSLRPGFDPVQDEVDQRIDPLLFPPYPFYSIPNAERRPAAASSMACLP